MFAYIIQYSNLNYKFFNQYKNEIKYSVGYIIETLPLATSGLIISSIGLISKVNKIRIKCFFISLILIYMIFKFKIFCNIKGFGKQGLIHNFGGLSFFIIFSLFPLNNFKKKTLKNIINCITNFTAGIYFLHIIVYKILIYNINLIKKKTIFGCIIIYLISYLISFIGYIIFKKTKIRYLFK